MWRPSITPSQVLMHSQGPWEDHKYIKVVDGKYYYPNSYKDGRTISDLKDKDKDDKKTESKSELKDEDIDKIADETIKGQHGNGQDRKEKFGSDYARIQNKVNEKLGVKKRHSEDEDDSKKDDTKTSKEKTESEKKEETKESKSDKDTKEEKDSKKESEKKSKGSSSKAKRKKNTESGGKGVKKGSKAKTSGKASGDSSGKSAFAENILNKREQERKQREKARRQRLNAAQGKSYLNHSGIIWTPTVSSDELYHFGILGQKKGVRNGPPYPLGSDQISAGEKKEGWLKKFGEKRAEAKKKKKQQKTLEKARQKRAANKRDAEERKRIVEKGTQDEVLRNRHRLSTEEMNKALDRLKQEDIVNKKIRELGPDYKRIDQFENFASQAKRIATGTQQFIDAYNTGAGIYNAVMTFKGNDKRLPKINYQGQNGPSDIKPNSNHGNNNNNGGGKNNAPKILSQTIKNVSNIQNKSRSELLQQAMTKAVVNEKKKKK